MLNQCSPSYRHFYKRLGCGFCVYMQAWVCVPKVILNIIPIDFGESSIYFSQRPLHTILARGQKKNKHKDDGFDVKPNGFNLLTFWSNNYSFDWKKEIPPGHITTVLNKLYMVIQGTSGASYPLSNCCVLRKYKLKYCPEGSYHGP